MVGKKNTEGEKRKPIKKKSKKTVIDGVGRLLDRELLHGKP